MQRRGRSRQISTAAIARQASEERHRTRRALENSPRKAQPQRPPITRHSATKHSSPIISKPPLALKLAPPTPTPPIPPRVVDTPGDASSSSDSTSSSNSVPVLSPPHRSSLSPIRTPTSSESGDLLDHYDSPLPPPKSLEDQLHVAYALDDIRLAKMLLLRLKGVDVIRDDDPRIDAVRDEDFDECFVPAGGLDLGGCGKSREAYQEESRRREKERIEEEQRMERLKACERRWEAEKRRSQQEKVVVERRKSGQSRLSEEKANVEKIRSTPTRPGLRRSVVAYGINYVQPSSPGASTSKLYDAPFQYEFMPPPKLSSTPRRPMAKVSSYAPTSSVSFKAVMNSMSGPLFPLEPAEQTRSQDRIAPDTAIDKDLQRRSWPIKQPSNRSSRVRRTSLQRELLANLLKVVEWEDGERRRIKGKAARPNPKTPCAGCSAASSSTSSGTTPSRSSSWLSFGGSCQSSASTAATTPSTSPISSWLKGSSSFRVSSPIPSIPSSPLPPSPVSMAPHRLTCPHSKGMTPVLPSDSPLPIPVDHPKMPQLGGTSSRRSSLLDDDAEIITDIGEEKTNSTILGNLVELAKTFQIGYISATVSSVTTSGHRQYAREEPSSSPITFVVKKMRLRPPGYRASRSDVAIFTSYPPDDYVPPSCAPQLIPLTSPCAFAQTEVQQRTLTFPRPASVPRSPFRPVIPPPALLWRPRPVANPMILRLKALQNIMCERGQQWEGRGRDGGLGCGKEKLVGVAWEGLGRSGLGWEVAVTSC